MTTYKATYEFEAASPEEAAQKVFVSLHLADIDGNNVKLEQVKDGGEIFSYPLARSVIRALNEDKRETVRRLATATQPAAEGDWALNGGQHLGEDID